MVKNDCEKCVICGIRHTLWTKDFFNLIDLIANAEEFGVGFNPNNIPKNITGSYLPKLQDPRDNREAYISWLRFVGTNGQQINDQNDNRVTEIITTIKRYQSRLSTICSRLNENTDTRIDCYYKRGLFDIAPKNDFEHEIQFSRAWNCSYKFNELPMSILLGTRPLIIISNTIEEYALEGQDKERNLQEDDKQNEERKPKPLEVKQIEDQYKGNMQNQTLLCGMCIQHHEALYYCTTCELNICCRCHRFHKDVWIMMNHALHLLSENIAD